MVRPPGTVRLRCSDAVLLSKLTATPAAKPIASCNELSPPVSAPPLPTDVVSTFCVEEIVAALSIDRVVVPLSIKASALFRATEIAATGTTAIPPPPEARASVSVVDVCSAVTVKSSVPVKTAPPATLAVTSFSVMAKASDAPIPSLPEAEPVLTTSSLGVLSPRAAKK